MEELFTNAEACVEERSILTSCEKQAIVQMNLLLVGLGNNAFFYYNFDCNKR